MDTSEIFIGREKSIEILNASRERIKKKKGTVIFISGETGFGKTTLMRYFEKDTQLNDKALVSMSACQAPVGNFMVGALQPLGPFIRLLEELKNSEKVLTPQKKLALNIGITLLTSVPYVGDVIDAANKISKDVQSYKSEKDKYKDKKEVIDGKEQIHVTFYKRLEQWCNKSPLILILDDMHWCDPESTLLLEQLAQNISKLPILIIVAYRKSIAEEMLSPILSVLREFKQETASYVHIDITTFNKAELHAMCAKMLPNYISNAEFEQILFDKTNGIPSVLAEYLKYFQKVTPFLPDGSINNEFKRGELLPSSVHAAFSKLIESLNEEEITLLSLCAAEGAESSAFIISKLLNIDVVSSIRKIKRVQAKTGVIRSLGPHERYGVKTTLFEFTQTLYRDYFEKSLEYEEKTAIHTQILAVLNEQIKDMDETERARVTPYLAAHATGAGELQQAQQFVMDIAKNTQQFAMPSMSSYALQQFDSITHALNTPLSPEMAISRARAGAELKNSFPEYDVKEIVQLAKTNTGESNTDHSANSSTDSHEQYDVSQNNVIEDILHTVLEADTAAIQREMLAASDNLLYQEAVKIGTDFLSTYAGSISKNDESIISILIARLSITIGDTKSALFFIKEVKNLLAKNPDTLISCLYHNAKASLHLSEQDFNSAWRELQNAANESSHLGYEYQLLTISNISILLAKGNKPSDAVKYRKAAKSLGKALKLQGFLEHLKKFS